MQEEKWQIILTGTYDTSLHLDDAVLALIKTLRINEQTARQLLDGKTHVLKKNIDSPTAHKYQQVLKNIGIHCRIELMTTPPALTLADDMSLLPISTKETTSTKSISNKAPIENDNSDDDGNNNSVPFWKMPIVRQLGVLLAIVVAISLLIPRFQSHYKPVGSDARAAAQIQALNISHQQPETDMNQLRGLIETGDYSTAERILRELQDNVNQDINWESTYQSTFDNISYKSNFSLASLDRWVENSGSAISYLARGSYYMAQGNKERGVRLASETDDKQFDIQGDMHAKGAADVQKALSMDPTLFHGYALLIMASDSRGISISPDEVLQKAIAVAPGGYYFRYQYLRTRMPKWGGSFKAMKEFTDSQEQYLHYNPRIWLLNGFSAAEKAHTAEDKRDYRDAIKLYSEALQYGIHPKWLTHRAYCLSQIKEYEKALSDINLSLQYLEDSYARQLQRSLKMQQ